ncbi:MAG: SdrD B-like domain-containing protein [Umezawaea sp.]
MLARIAAVSAAVVLVTTGVSTGAASADPLPYAELEASAAFDKPSFDAAETVVATITIRNVGGVAALKVKADTGFGSTFNPSSWGAIAPFGSGVRIEAGETLVTKVTGRVYSGTQLVFKGKVTSNPFDGNQANNAFEATAGVTYGTGSVAYTAYADGNGNGQADAGEGIPGVRVDLWGSGNHQRITGSDGTALFTDVRSGAYSVVAESPDGWLFPGNAGITVTTDQRLDVVRKGVRPLSDTLAATVEFDQDTYAVGDTANVTITLTNTGTDLPVVHARCGGDGESYDLYNNTAGWGALKYAAEGVPLGSGETKVLHVSAPLTARAEAHGFIRAYCSFGPEVEPQRGAPLAVDKARIPGGVSDATGVVLHDHDGDASTPGQPVVGVEIGLLDVDSGQRVATAVTDSTGSYSFTGVPVGWYTPVLDAQWRLVLDGNTTIRIVTGAVHRLRLTAVPAT